MSKNSAHDMVVTEEQCACHYVRPIKYVLFISHEYVNKLHSALQKPLYCSVAVTFTTNNDFKQDRFIIILSTLAFMHWIATVLQQL